MTDRGFDVRWRGVDGRARKLAFEPATAATCALSMSAVPVGGSRSVVNQSKMSASRPQMASWRAAEYA